MEKVQMTIEEAVANAAAWQEQLDEMTELLKNLTTSDSQWRRTFLAKTEAKIALEWYQGYTDRSGTYHAGMIQKLIGKADQLRAASNLGERFSNRTFANFHPDSGSQTAFDVCRSYANQDLFHSRKNSLILLGSTGTGKTHLAAAVSHVLIERGIPVLFHTYSEHLEQIRTEFNHAGEKQYLSLMKNTPLLVLDDIGRERRSDWSDSVLFDVVNGRYEHQLPLIITSNFTAAELADHVGNAVWSRLYETAAMVVMDGADYRLKVS